MIDEIGKEVPKILNNRIFFGTLLILILVSTIYSLSVLTTGGLLLMFGAVYIYIGNIFFSTIVYTIADVCWLVNAHQNDDTLGAISVTVGIVVGVIVANKMRRGTFKKSIRKDTKDGEIYEVEENN